MPINGNIPFDVNGGDPIKHQDFNDILRQLRMLSSTAGDGNGLVTAAGTFFNPKKKTELRDPAYVWVKNNTGADITVPYPVLALGAAVNQPTGDADDTTPYLMPTFAGTTPDADTVNFAILQGKVDAGEWQKGIILGGSWVKLHVDSESDDHADVTTGHNDYLMSGTSGPAKILWKESSGTSRWAYVNIDTGSGGGGHIVATITGVADGLGDFETCDYVIATVNEVSCNMTGVSIGDEVKIWDGGMCYFGLPIDLLYGLRVHAELMQNNDIDPYNTADCQDAVNAAGNCRFIATGICCGEEYAV